MFQVALRKACLLYTSFNLNNIDIFKSRTRGRFLGINVWVNDIGNIKDIGMKLFEFNLAPGFSKAELKAIMPKGAKMYELSDLVGSDWQSNYPWLNSGNQNMNSALFSGASSNGDGNGSIYTKRGSGIMGLQHIPLSLIHILSRLKLSISTKCPCVAMVFPPVLKKIVTN